VLYKLSVSIRHSRGLMLVIYKQGAINQWIIEKNLVEVIKREPLSYSCRRQPIAILRVLVLVTPMLKREP